MKIIYINSQSQFKLAKNPKPIAVKIMLMMEGVSSLTPSACLDIVIYRSSLVGFSFHQRGFVTSSNLLSYPPPYILDFTITTPPTRAQSCESYAHVDHTFGFVCYDALCSVASV